MTGEAAGAGRNPVFPVQGYILELPAGNHPAMLKTGVRLNYRALPAVIRLLLNIRMKSNVFRYITPGTEKIFLPVFRQIRRTLKNPGRETYRPGFQGFLTAFRAGIKPCMISRPAASLTASRGRRINSPAFPPLDTAPVICSSNSRAPLRFPVRGASCLPVLRPLPEINDIPENLRPCRPGGLKVLREQKCRTLNKGSGLQGPAQGDRT
jgi:hypothetical protein